MTSREPPSHSGTTRYLDFDVTVAGHTPPTYQVYVSTPAWGDVTTEIDFDPESVEGHLDALDSDAVTEELLVEFGTQLFDVLLPRDATAALMVSLGHARALQAGLRVRLRFNAPELRRIPWEFLYVPFFHNQLGADIDTPLARRVGVFGEIAAIEAGLPIRILVVAPQGSGLNIKREIANLEDAISHLGSSIDRKILNGKVTLTDLTDALESDTFHVLHFVGHGKMVGESGYLEINDESGVPTGLSEDQLKGIFDNHRSMKLAVLNACKGGATLESAKAFSGLAANLVATGIPAVVAHQYPITDGAAIAFSRAFYRALILGPNAGMVEDAVARARKALAVEFPSNRVIGATVLYLRGPSGKLFTIEPPSPQDLADIEELVRVQDGYVQELRDGIEKSTFVADEKRRALDDAETYLKKLQDELTDLKSRMSPNGC